ncbi:sugar phosphate isomerase/epimerase family protein [Halochromatium glycolicum]|jgi:sugar phosphate isomerase/epimerase|uniref:Xylose isomerase-like TIM barrel domain-containing protein n=1 Tax=Halochromatium glycolicum TaxID=85075 RepID=A0AAJ0U1A0_9GAMM|nr:sugar phosphate isomerase/epimerase family protein [Halochromatium glycolicum]MBK1703002.1 hypothetical protein [Halochromatium glycolicum]
MRIAYSTNAYTRYELATACDRIAALGFDGLEILCDRPHWFPGETTMAEADQLRARLLELGLSVSNLNANTANGFFDPPPPETVFEPSLSSADPERRRWRLNYSIEALRLAARVGARNISITSGRPESGGTPRQGIELFVDSLKRLCDAAEPMGVRVGVEYEPGLLVECASELAEVIDRVGSALLGANLDIGHSWLAREEPATVAALLNRRVWNVHIEDIAAYKHFHLVPGEGDLPIELWLDALSEAGFGGLHTVELYTYAEAPDEAGRSAIAYLRRIAAQRAKAAGR